MSQLAGQVEQIAVSSGVDVSTLLLDLRDLPSTAILIVRMVMVSLVFACAAALRVAGSLLRFQPSNLDLLAAAVMALFFLAQVRALLAVRSGVALLARTVSLTPRQLDLLQLGRHRSLYSKAAARLAAAASSMAFGGDGVRPAGAGGESAGQAQPQQQADAAAGRGRVASPAVLNLRRRQASAGANGSASRRPEVLPPISSLPGMPPALELLAATDSLRRSGVGVGGLGGSGLLSTPFGGPAMSRFSPGGTTAGIGSGARSPGEYLASTASSAALLFGPPPVPSDALDAAREAELGLGGGGGAEGAFGAGGLRYGSSGGYYGGGGGADGASLPSAVAAAIDRAAALREADLAAHAYNAAAAGGGGLDAAAAAGSAWGATSGAGGGGGGSNLFGLSQLIGSLWRADGETLLRQGAAASSSGAGAVGFAGRAAASALRGLGGALGGDAAGAAPSSFAEEDADLASTVAPVDRAREPYLAATAVTLRGGGTPVLHISRLRAPLGLPNEVQALEAVAACVQRVLHRHWHYVFRAKWLQNAADLAACNGLLSSEFLARAPGSAARTVALPGVRGGVPLTLDELLVEMTSRGRGDSRYMVRRDMRAAAAAVDRAPFFSLSLPPLPTSGTGTGAGAAAAAAPAAAAGAAAAKPALGALAAAAGAGAIPPIGQPNGVAEQMFRQRLAAENPAALAAADRAQREGEARARRQLSAVIDLWQERADLEALACPPPAVLAAAGVIPPSAAAVGSGAAGGGGAGGGGGGGGGSACLGEVKAYCLARLSVLLGDKALSRFLGNADPASAGAGDDDGAYGYGSSTGAGVAYGGGASGGRWSGRPSDSLLLINYFFGLLDAELIRAARFAIRAVAAHAAGGNGGAGRGAAGGAAAAAAGVGGAPLPPPFEVTALTQQIARMSPSDRPFSRAHLVFGAIPAPTASPATGGGVRSAAPGSRGGAAGALADSRSPLALPELASCLSGTSTVVEAQRPRVRLYHNVASRDPATLLGLTLPALQSLFHNRHEVTALLSAGQPRDLSAGGAATADASAAAVSATDPAATVAAVDVGNGASASASRLVVPRTLALFLITMQRTYRREGAAAEAAARARAAAVAAAGAAAASAVGGAASASASRAAKAASALPLPSSLFFCDVPLSWAVHELTTADAASRDV